MSVQALSKIGDQILADARTEAQKRIEEANAFGRELIEKAKADAEKDAEKIRSKFLSEAKLLESKRLSDARREASELILKEKNQLMNKVFKESLKKLKEFVDKGSYLKRLTSLIENSASQLGLEEIKLELNNRDLKRKEEVIKKLNLPKKIKISVAEIPLKNFGGFIISSSDGRIKVDETFDGKILFAEKRLRKDISKVLLGKNIAVTS